jgi:phosphoglycolate phosphatase
MAHYDYVLFDLDGTLVDSCRGLTQSFVYSLQQCGYEDKATNQVLRQFIGGTLHDAFAGLCGLNEAETEKAIRIFAEHYAEKGMLADRLYPGMERVLPQLQKEGHALIVVTNGIEDIAMRILTHLQVSGCFTAVCGMKENSTMHSKSDIIRKLKKTLLTTEGRSAVMIGDRRLDIAAGRECGLDTIAVGYGYGSAEELIASRPTQYCRRPEDLLDALN